MNLAFKKLCSTNIEDAANVIILTYAMLPWYILWPTERYKKSSSSKPTLMWNSNSVLMLILKAKENPATFL